MEVDRSKTPTAGAHRGAIVTIIRRIRRTSFAKAIYRNGCWLIRSTHRINPLDGSATHRLGGVSLEFKNDTKSVSYQLSKQTSMRGHQVPVKVEQLPDCSSGIKSEYE
jgi:hypothetical protein